VLECVRTTDVLDLNGRMVTIHAGEFVIGDVKSGDNIKHPWLEILIQEALYAHAVNENGVAVQDEPGGPFRWEALASFGVDRVREDVGVVMHVPYGSGTCHFYAADLITGWRGAKICRDNREFWKIQLPKVPIVTYTVSNDYGSLPVGPPASPDLYDNRPELVRPTGTTILPEGTSFTGFNGPETDDRVTCFCGDKWDNIETANAYDHDYESCATADETEVECECGQTWASADSMTAAGHGDTICQPEPVSGSVVDYPPVPDPEEPGHRVNNIMEAVHRAKHATKEEVRKILDQRNAGVRRGRWEDEFRACRTREEANEVWRNAKAVGLPPKEIKRLVALVKLEDPKPQEPASGPGSNRSEEPVAEKPPAPSAPAQQQDGRSLAERAHAVTTKAEASAVWKEMQEKIKTLPEDERASAKAYRDKLAKIMTDRLASA
jgi:hypothetical protein